MSVKTQLLIMMKICKTITKVIYKVNCVLIILQFKLYFNTKTKSYNYIHLLLVIFEISDHNL